MSFINNIFKFYNNPNLALDLFNTLSVGYEPSKLNKFKINLILKKCNSRQDILNKVIEICGLPDTPQKRYIYAMAYGWSNKEYRQKAIYYINLYINNDLYEDVYIHKLNKIDSSIEQRKNEHLCSIYDLLAEIYIKEYEFENALKFVNMCINIDPKMPLFYRKKVEILIKTHNIDLAINFLNDIKNSSYYSKNNDYVPKTWFIDTIDELLNNCEELKKKKYVYKPRKSNINYV